MIIVANNNVNRKTLSETTRNTDQVIAYSILGKLRPEAPSPPRACIYRIPDPQKKLHEKDFVPSLVSIGPFHHGKRNLQAMEEMKLWCSHNLLIERATPQTKMEHIVDKIRSMEGYCRDCYAEKIDLSSEKFVEMLVVDGFFITELFQKIIGDVPGGMNDLFNSLVSTVQNDLLLLENQLPWRVLDCLFHRVPGGKCKSLCELTQRALPSWWGLEYSASHHVPNTLQSRHSTLSESFQLKRARWFVHFGCGSLLRHSFSKSESNLDAKEVSKAYGVMEIAPITLDAENLPSETS